MRLVALALAVVAVFGACRGGATKTRRTGSAAAVEIVTQPQLPDAGHGAGATTDEIEPNDSDDVATPLALGSTVRGRIDPDGDVDHYRIDVAQAGALSVTVSGIDGVDLVLELEDASGSVIAKSDRGGVRVREGVPNFGVTPGRYTAVVHAAPRKGKPKPSKNAKTKKPDVEPPKPPAPVYEITAQVTAPAAGAEREPDDDRGTANDLILADTATGFVGWSGDADVWKLSVETLAANNAIDIEVSPVEGVALELEVADGVGQSLMIRKAPRGAKLVVRGLVPVVPAGAPPYHYLTIRGDRSNPETAYQLRVTAHPVGTDVEIEPDDTPEKPFAIPADRTRVHATWTPGDVDCFALPVEPAARTIDALIDAPAEVDLAAELLIDGKPLAKSDHPGKGTAERVSGVVPAGAHAVIRVRGADPSATAEGAYDVTVQESGATGDNAP